MYPGSRTTGSSDCTASTTRVPVVRTNADGVFDSQLPSRVEFDSFAGSDEDEGAETMRRRRARFEIKRCAGRAAFEDMVSSMLLTDIIYGDFAREYGTRTGQHIDGDI